MKLLTKYRTYTYTSLVFVVVIGFTINYYLFRFSIHRTTDDVLNEYRLDIEKYGENNGTLEGFNSIDNKLCRVYRNVDLPVKIDENIRDTLVYSHYEQEMVVYRKLKFVVATDSQNYIVELMLPTLEEHDLLQTVGISLVLFVLLFILFTTIMDRSMTVKILRPFTRIIEVMRTYNIERHTNIRLKDEGIDEFMELNTIFNSMVAKINQGYEDMKDFLEHTSHEMKTPLAIIQLKLETLSQKDFKDEETINCISSIQKSLNRIVRFNRSLLFIAKIQNNQFEEARQININMQVSQFLDIYSELLMERDIKVNTAEGGTLMMKIHPILAEQLINNILINAVKYNHRDGIIDIDITESEIKVRNTFDGNIPQGNLFEKYRHSSATNDSSGLGLAIVKQICDKNNLAVDYTVHDREFLITVIKK